MSLVRARRSVGEHHKWLARLRPWLAELHGEHARLRMPLAQPRMPPGALPGPRAERLRSQGEECLEMASIHGQLPSKHGRQRNDGWELALPCTELATDCGWMPSRSPEMASASRQIANDSAVIGS